MSNGRQFVDLDRTFEAGLSLVGAASGNIAFDLASARRKSQLTFRIPNQTKFVSVSITAFELYFNTERKPMHGTLGGFIVQGFKKRIEEIEQDAAQRGEFEVDVIALLEGVGEQKDWSGIVFFDVLCFG
ncbi:MAG: hypothetical protein P8182_20305 [Deltaproteobacteria bacterium]